MLFKISILPESVRYIVLAAIIVIAVGIRLFTYLGARNRPLAHIDPGAERNYGIAGGAICPRCNRPYPLDLLSPHILNYKLGRCPFCGKMAFVRRAGMDELRAAEARELQDSQPTAPATSEDEALRKLIDDSKYTDSRD